MAKNTRSNIPKGTLSPRALNAKRIAKLAKKRQINKYSDVINFPFMVWELLEGYGVDIGRPVEPYRTDLGLFA
jgi:hypothetical protein